MRFLNQFLKFAADQFFMNKDGVVANNLYEKLALKVEKKPAVSVGDCVMPVNPICTVYGDYRNQLSVRCDDVVAAPVTGADGKKA